ncbi:hypothetical protein [Sodalis sp. (in: enterobacteria)]|uniref:hypothetical protein n=1 Tax=Sodalis sp. (in: enterobacteria) TaxID=1898979 RepID=UPI003F2ABF44
MAAHLFIQQRPTLTVPQWVSLEGAGIETSQIRCTAPNDSVSPIVKVTGSHNGIRKMTLRYATRPSTKGVGIISTSFQAKYHQIQIIDCNIGAWVYNPDSKESAGSGQVWSDFFIKDCYYAGMIVGANNNDFYNDLYLSNFLMVADSTCFKFGALRLLGRIESLNVEYCDIMGGVHSLTSDPGKTSGVRFSVFTSMYLDSATYSCQFNGINHSSFTDCWISGGRKSGSSGAEFQSCHSFSMTGMRAYNCGSNAITFKSCNNFTVDKTIIGGNNKSSIPGTPDVNFIGCDKFNVVNTHGTDVGNTNYGIRIASGCTAYTLMNNKFTERSARLILEDDINSASRLVDGNPGYTTRSGGRASLPAGAKSVDVSHGLSVEPKINMVTIQQNGQTLTPLYVSSVSKGTFTVSTLQENQSGASFSWMVDATRSG